MITTTEVMDQAIIEIITGKNVVELQAGNCELARFMTKYAHYVTAIDKVERKIKHNLKNLNIVWEDIENLQTDIMWKDDCYWVGFEKERKHYYENVNNYVAVMSWPLNRKIINMVRILEQSKYIIYIGSNTNGNSCGDFSIWQYLTSRRLLKVIAHRFNTLLIYENTFQHRDLIHHEEYAALNCWGKNPEEMEFKDSYKPNISDEINKERHEMKVALL